MIIKFIILCVFSIAILSNCLSPNSCDNYRISKEWMNAQLFSATDSVLRINKLADAKIQINTVFFGDSIIEEWNSVPLLSGGYNWTADPTENTGIINAAVAGNTSCDLIDREPLHVKVFNPLYIFFSGGGNDFKYGAQNSVIQHNLNILLNMMRKDNPDARIVYMEILPTKKNYANDNKESINNYVKQSVIPEIGNACIVEVKDFLAGSETEGMPVLGQFSLDGTHLRPNAYVELKKRAEYAFTVKQLYDLPSWLTCSY